MNKRTESALTNDELQEVLRRRAEAKARLRATPYDEVESTTIDPENPPLTDEQLARMRPAHEVVPQLVAARLRRDNGGRSPSQAPREAVSIHLDADVIARLRESGIDWQAWVNEMLRTALRMKG